MDEHDLEIVVKPGNWQTPGKATRWSWQVRQKHPPKFLVQGMSAGSEQKAHDAAKAAKAKLLARADQENSLGSRGTAESN